jgi:hypothetical protein
VFEQLESKRGSADTTQFVNSYIDIGTKKPINPKIQQDSANFLMNLLTRLDDFLEITKAPNFIRRMFKPIRIVRTTCQKCNHLLFKTADEYIVPMRVSECKSLYDSLNFLISKKQSNFKCPECPPGQNIMEEDTLYSYFPNTLVFQLHRYVNNTKIRTCYKFPVDEELDMFKYSVDSTKDMRGGYGSKGRDYYIYQLVGVIVHSGPSLSSGHYYSYIKETLGNKWICLDDEKVKEVTSKKEMEENFFGGKTAEAEMNARKYNLKEEDVLNQHTGMILFYERKKPQELYSGELTVRNVIGEKDLPLIPRTFPLMSASEMEKKGMIKGNSIPTNMFETMAVISPELLRMIKQQQLENLNESQIVKMFYVFQEVANGLRCDDLKDTFDDVEEKNSNKPSSFNIPFTSSIYCIDSFCVDPTSCFLWLWMNFLMNVCSLSARIGGKVLKKELERVMNIVKRNRRLLVWLVWYGIKGEGYLKVPLSTLMNNNYSPSSTSFPPSTESVYSKFKDNLNNKEFGVVYDFLVNQLLSDVRFENVLELELGFDCFIEMCKNPPSPINRMEMLCKNIIQKLSDNLRKIDLCVYFLKHFIILNDECFECENFKNFQKFLQVFKKYIN